MASSKKTPGGIRVHGCYRGFEPQALRPLPRSSRELRHPGNFSQQNRVTKRLTPALQLGIVSSVPQFPRQAETLERRTVLYRNDLGGFTAVA